MKLFRSTTDYKKSGGSVLMMKRFFSVIISLLILISGISCNMDSEVDPASDVGGGGGNSSGGGNKNIPAFKNSDNKRGLCFEKLNEAEIKVISESNVKWVYNWGTHPSDAEDALLQKYGVLYIPMQWGSPSAQNLAELRTYYTNHPECKYLLGYNEPNLGGSVGGSGIPPKKAAQDWDKLEAIADEFGLELVGPALQYSGEKLSDGKIYSTPKAWMDAFISEYKKLHDGKEPRFDYFCLHCYMNWPAAQSGYVKEYVGEYGKKVWLTEFCAWEYNNGGQNESAAKQKESMIEKVNFLDSYEGADKYAWFMSSQHTNDIPFNSLFPKVGSDGSLTSLGESYFYLGMENSASILLESAIKTAAELNESTEAGSNPGQYPEAKISALRAALQAANEAKENGDENQKKSALTALNNAIKDLENSRIPWFTKSKSALDASSFASSLTKDLSEDAFTSSASRDENVAKKAFDGNVETRWESEHADNQWLIIDFGSQKEFNAVKFLWEPAYASSFSVEVSNDGENWTLAMEEDNGTGGSESYRLTLEQNARYVRFNGKGRATTYGFSFWEMGVFKE